MRTFRTQLGFYNSLQEARTANRQAIARCAVLRNPAPSIVKWKDGSFLVNASLIVKPWSESVNHKGAIRGRLAGVPVKSPRPKKVAATPRQRQKRRR